MGTMILRFFLILICSIGGFFIAGELFGTKWALLWGAPGGVMVAILSILVEESVKKVSLRSLCGAALGLIAGFVVAKLLADAFLSDILGDTRISLAAYLVTYSIPAYIGMKIGLKKGEEFTFVLEGSLEFQTRDEVHRLKSGDSLYFESDIPHAYRTLGPKNAKAVVVVFSTG